MLSLLMYSQQELAWQQFHYSFNRVVGLLVPDHDHLNTHRQHTACFSSASASARKRPTNIDAARITETVVID